MNLRQATESDLPALKAMYRRIIAEMERNGIRIWDDVYPCEILIDDIRTDALFLLEQNGEPLAAFALCPATGGIETMKWKEPHAPARYVERLGVDPDHLRQGIGAAALCHAIDLTRALGGRYLRLFVVDKNTPAIDLYRKVGFRRAEGIYQKYIFDDFLLSEYGFEIEV